MKYKNPLSNLTFEETKQKYNLDIQKNKDIKAYSENDKTYLLVKIAPEKVEFIGGFWRIQRSFNYQIEKIYDQYFILTGQIPKSELPAEEIPIFNYYRALLASPNCYGFYGHDFGHIIANCGDLYRYGNNISEARSKLSSNIIDNLTKNCENCTDILTMITNQKIK